MYLNTPSTKYGSLEPVPNSLGTTTSVSLGTHLSFTNDDDRRPSTILPVQAYETMSELSASHGIDTVTIASLFVEAVLYGFFVSLFIASSMVLLRKARISHTPINKPMIVASVTMLVLATVHLAVDLRRALDAFVHHVTDEGGPKPFLARVNTPMYVLKSTAYGAQTLVGDAFILYRLYLVWDGDKRIVFPLCVCFTASIGVGVGAVQGFAKAAPEDPIFLNKLQQWIVSFFSLTLFTNFMSTGLIAFRIWYIHRSTKKFVSGDSVIPAMVIIIESGSIYSACLVILLALYLSGSFAQYIVLDAVTQVIGVVFSLVIIRVALGVSNDSHKKRTRKLTTLAFHHAQTRGEEGVTTEEMEFEDSRTNGAVDLMTFTLQYDQSKIQSVKNNAGSDSGDPR